MQTLYEVARLLSLPATTSLRTGLWAVSNGLEVLTAPASTLPREVRKGNDGHRQKVECLLLDSKLDIASAEKASSVGFGPWLSALWTLPQRGFSSIRSMLSMAIRIVLLLSVSSILYYVVPVCGSSLRAPLHLLPVEFGAEALAEVQLRSWANTLATGDILVDAELEMTVPNSQFNSIRFMESIRVDLELGNIQVSRPLILPYLSPTAQHIRELLWAFPIAFGLCYDEAVIRLQLATGLLPEDLAKSEAAKLRLSPSLMVRTAELSLTPRFAGPLGRPLNSFVVFVPLCALLLYLGLDKRSTSSSQRMQTICCQGAAAKICSSKELHFIEVQMLAKALSGSSVISMFSATLAAFEAEDRAYHGDVLHGKVKLDRLPMVLESVLPEWKVNFDEWQIRNLIGTTLILPPTKLGLVTQDGHLRYRLWLAVATVTQLYGDGKLVDYAAWVERHECSTKEPVTGN